MVHPAKFQHDRSARSEDRRGEARHSADPEVAALKVEDLRESRLVVCDPAPIPLEEMQRTYDWLKSWGMLEATASPLELVNPEVQPHAHQAAE